MHALLLNLWERHRFTVVMVTHDVDEALSLADRVAVVGSGQIIETLELGQSRPRDRQDSRFNTSRKHLLAQLGVPAL